MFIDALSLISAKRTCACRKNRRVKSHLFKYYKYYFQRIMKRSQPLPVCRLAIFAGDFPERRNKKFSEI